jgi:hypothetical protein
MREESIDAVDDAVQVHVEDLVEVRGVGPVAVGAYAGVEVQEVELDLGLLELGFEGGSVLLRRDVERVGF